jgi:hypothetical protein
MGRNICGKALRMTWKMSNDARICERVSMGYQFLPKLSQIAPVGNSFSTNQRKRQMNEAGSMLDAG